MNAVTSPAPPPEADTSVTATADHCAAVKTLVGLWTVEARTKALSTKANPTATSTKVAEALYSRAPSVASPLKESPVEK